MLLDDVLSCAARKMLTNVPILDWVMTLFPGSTFYRDAVHCSTTSTNKHSDSSLHNCQHSQWCVMARYCPQVYIVITRCYLSRYRHCHCTTTCQQTVVEGSLLSILKPSQLWWWLRAHPGRNCCWTSVLRISGIASHFAPQIQANAMQQHFRITLIAMQNNARIIALSSANLPLTFGSDRRLDYCG